MSHHAMASFVRCCPFVIGPPFETSNPQLFYPFIPVQHHPPYPLSCLTYLCFFLASSISTVSFHFSSSFSTSCQPLSFLSSPSITFITHDRLSASQTRLTPFS